MLGQVREILLGVMQELLQLAHGQEAVLVCVPGLEELIDVLRREGRVDGCSISHHKDAAVTALHSEELVC